MIETSKETAKLDAALAKAQGSFTAAAKDTSNPFFKSKYADLASIWAACRSALTSHGIAVTQWLVESEGDRLGIVTRLACEGEWMMARWSMPVSKQDPQGYGSAATYARRYALAAALGVVADEDDDGNAASEKPKAKTYRVPADQERESAKKAMQRAQEEANKPSNDEEWKTRIQLAASVSVEELDSLQPEIDAVPDEMLRGRLRRYRDEIRKRAIARAEAKRIAKGEPPASSVPDDG